MKTFRARLTLWNVAVLGVILLAFALALIYSNQSHAAAGIDQELMDRARQALGPGPMGRPNMGPPPLPRFGIDEATRQLAEIRRPRMFANDGKSMGPQPTSPFDEAALQRGLAGVAGYSNAEFNGMPIRILTVPFLDRGHVQRVVQVARDTPELQQLWQSQLAGIAILIPVALIVAAGGALFLTGRAMRPIGKMQDAAAMIGESDLSRRLPVEGDDEFANLAQTFNAMVERLESAFVQLRGALVDLEKANENQRRFTADASHELRTPLTRLRLATDVAMARDATPEDARRAIEVADSTSRVMSRMVQELLLLARSDAGQAHYRKEPLDLRLVASDAVSYLPGGSADRICTEFDDSAVTILGDRESLIRLCTNLLENALRHTPREGRIVIRVSRGGGGLVQVQDTGEGIAAEHMPHLTERFYRVDAARSAQEGGSGLGLAICRTIAEAHHALLHIESELGKGTTVSVQFPDNSGTK